MHFHAQCPQPCSRPPPTHASARDSWTLTGKSESVSCGITAPFSWDLVHTRLFFCALQVSVSPVLCKFYKFCNQIPLASKVKFSGSFQSLCQIPRLRNLLRVLEKHRSASVSAGSLGPDVHKALFEANHGAFVCVWLFTIPWTVAHQVPLSVEFSRQEYWSRLPFPSPGDLPDPGIKPRSPALQADSLPSEPLEKPLAIFNMCVYKRKCPNPWG